MNRYKKIVLMLLVSLIPIALADSLEFRGAKDAIVFVERYQNWAWGYQCNGFFIDCRGNVYEFDYSDRKQSTSREEFQQALWDTYCNTRPVRRKICSSRKLFQILQEDVYKIDRKASYSRKSVACDAGQRTLFVCDADSELIELRSIGDVEEELQDATAEKLCNYYDEITWSYYNDIVRRYLYKIREFFEEIF